MKAKSTAKTLRSTEQKLVKNVVKSRQVAFERFPLVFTLLGAFGLVATFYGFEGIIDNIDLLTDNPWLILATGIGVLTFTGTLYKRLQ